MFPTEQGPSWRRVPVVIGTHPGTPINVTAAACGPRVLWQVARQRPDGDQLVVAGLGQLVMGVTFIPLFYGRAPLVATERGGSCSVLYSDLLRAVGTPVPGEMINGASHYGGSPLILLNKDSRMVAREHEGRPGRRCVNETERLATDEPATRLVSARGV